MERFRGRIAESQGLNTPRRHRDDDEHPLASGSDPDLPVSRAKCSIPGLDRSHRSDPLSRAAESRGIGSVRIPVGVHRRGQSSAPVPVRDPGGRRIAGVGRIPGGRRSNPAPASGTGVGGHPVQFRRRASAGPRTLGSDSRLHAERGPRRGVGVPCAPAGGSIPRTRANTW